MDCEDPSDSMTHPCRQAERRATSLWCLYFVGRVCETSGQGGFWGASDIVHYKEKEGVFRFTTALERPFTMY